MNTLKKNGRIWHFSGKPEMLFPWSENLETPQGTLVKQNRNRSVWRVSASDGNTYYVKRECKMQIPFFASKAEREFKSYALLERKNIPSAEYVAWSSTHSDCVIVSKALPETFCSMQQFWYSSPEPSGDFLEKICHFLAEIANAGIFHPDFHMGNLMTDGEDILLIDPFGIREIPSTTAPQPEMLIPLTETFRDFPMEKIAEVLHRSGLYGSIQDALNILSVVDQRKQERITREWEKRKKQILGGTSKFATETEPGVFVRNTAWFTPLLRYPQEHLTTEIFSAGEGEDFWLSSFEDQLRKKKRERIPVVYRKTGVHTEISYLSDKKYSFFYGFR